MAYYDGTKLLSMKDLNGREPELFMVTTNRTGGKTTWFSVILLRNSNRVRVNSALYIDLIMSFPIAQRSSLKIPTGCSFLMMK